METYDKIIMTVKREFTAILNFLSSPKFMILISLIGLKYNAIQIVAIKNGTVENTSFDVRKSKIINPIIKVNSIFSDFFM
ncbi:MAG: hypothetical protein ABI207_01465 [Crocinitomicaceae bacterium]